MSEMEWEEAPPVYVRRVRPWLGSALRDWTNTCYPQRRGVFVVWGCLFIIPWAFFQCVKFFVWLTGVGVALAWYPVHVAIELATYHERYKRAVIEAWGPYMKELHGEA